MTIAIAVMLCISMALPAFAAGEISGTEAKPARAAITKKLTTTDGTTTPTVTFGFEFEKKALNGNSAAEDLALIPKISNHEINFTNIDTATPVNDIKTMTKEKVIDLTGVDFPYAGSYTYTVKELQNITAGTLDPNKEAMSYSKAEYEITFFIKEKTDGTGLYVSDIGTKIMIKDNGSAGTEGKVDPTPGDENGNLGAGGLVFNNAYTKTTGGEDPTNPNDQVFSILNSVAGDFADTGKYFEYIVAITKPLVEGVSDTYKAYILNDLGAVIDPTQSTTGLTINQDAAGRKYIEFTSGIDKRIKLKHGEKLVFTDVPVGAVYVTQNFGAPDYTPTAKVLVNGVEINPGLSAGVGQSLSSLLRKIGETTPNAIEFTNTHKSIPVTGLIINNIPFIMILVISVGAFLAFVITKSRKNKKAQ